MLARDKRQFGFRLMLYRLEFYEEAYKEWKKPDGSIKEQFRIKLTERGSFSSSWVT
jgi:mRNA-degrading endonuclease RelE of RelBE toxin-antitoxin system